MRVKLHQSLSNSFSQRALALMTPAGRKPDITRKLVPLVTRSPSDDIDEPVTIFRRLSHWLCRAGYGPTLYVPIYSCSGTRQFAVNAVIMLRTDHLGSKIDLLFVKR